MAKFSAKAVPGSGKLKIGIYGKAGTGKTGTANLFAEWLAKEEGKRYLVIDTESSGTDPLLMAVARRKYHPEAFDFARLQTKQVLEVRDFIYTIDTKEYGCLVIDSMSHLWDSAQLLWTGNRKKDGGMPIQGYSVVKKYFRQMLDAALSADMHVIICGREQNEFERTENADWNFLGTRMRAEKETGHEPQITIQMLQERDVARREWKILMYVEKDRFGAMQGEVIEWPKGETIKPWYDLIKGVTHVPAQTLEQAAELDIVKIAEAEDQRNAVRVTTYNGVRDAILRANTHVENQAAWGLAKGKKGLLGDDLYEELENLKEEQKIRINRGMPSGKPKEVVEEASADA